MRKIETKHDNASWGGKDVLKLTHHHQATAQDIVATRKELMNVGNVRSQYDCKDLAHTVKTSRHGGSWHNWHIASRRKADVRGVVDSLTHRQRKHSRPDRKKIKKILHFKKL